jgi:hypothetical protein
MEDGAPSRLALLALLAGAAAGAAEGLIAGWFALVILFPIAIGLAAGFAATRVVTASKVRAPMMAALLAGLGGFAGQAVRHEVQYQRFVRSMADIDIRDTSQPADANDFLRTVTGHGGRAGYLLLRAQQGTIISRHGRSGPTLKGPAYWGLFALEFLLAGGTAFAVGWSRASAPFCERCQKWYGADMPVATGAGDKQSVKASLAALEASDWNRFAEGLGTPDTKLASAVLIAACPGCTDSDRRLTVRIVRRPGHRKEKAEPRFVSMIRPDELRGLQAALDARKQ